MTHGEMVVQWHQAGKPLVDIGKGIHVDNLPRFLAHALRFGLDEDIEKVGEAMRKLKLYVCSECHRAQHRMFLEDDPMYCLDCGANALEVRNG